MPINNGGASKIQPNTLDNFSRFGMQTKAKRLTVSVYMKRTLQILLTLFLFSCNSIEEKINSKQAERPKSQVVQPKYIDIVEPDHDTLPNGKRLLDNIDSSLSNYYKEVVGSDTLKGAYITCYGIDDSIKYFYLMHGKILHLLNKTPINTSTWGLGTLKKDFANSFMTQLDNGNGCPSSYQLFDKKTGSNILGKYVQAISYTYFKDTLFMLYDNRAKNRKLDSITLFNTTTKRKEDYKLPNNLPPFCDIQIDKLLKKNLKISFTAYVGDKFEKTKIYNR
jgi:hypothetical protein